MAIHVSLTAIDFFLAYPYPSAIHLHFFQNHSWFFPVLAVANTGSYEGPQNKIGHPCWMQVPVLSAVEYK